MCQMIILANFVGTFKFGNTVKKFWLAELYQLFIEETLVPAKRESCVGSSILLSTYDDVQYELDFMPFITYNFNVIRVNSC